MRQIGGIAEAEDLQAIGRADLQRQIVVVVVVVVMRLEREHDEQTMGRQGKTDRQTERKLGM